MEKAQKIEISTGTIIKTIILIIALVFLYLIRDIILLMFISVIIVAAIDPLVSRLQQKKVPRTVAATIIYLILFTSIGAAISFLIPSIISQFQDFTKNSAQYISQLNHSLGFEFLRFQNFGASDILNNLSDGISNFPQKIFSTTVDLFTGFVSVVVVFSVAFYMAIEEDGIKNFIVSITPQKDKAYVADLTDRIENKIGKWMAGQLIAMLIISVLIYVGLTLIGVPYALMLAIFAGMLEIVPYVGPIVSAIPGIILGFLISPTVGILALVIYVVAQQTESHIIVPQVMKKAVGLNPIATIVAILIGFKVAGVLGAFIAVPAATAISLFVSDYLMKKN